MFVYDSEAIIEENERLWQPNGWSLIWTRSYWGVREPAGLYRPLTLSMFRVEFNMLGFGKNPLPYLITNILLHSGCTLLLFYLISFWVPKQIPAFIGSAIFAVHPVASSVVPNLVGRSDLLALLFVIVGLIFWEQFQKTNRYLFFLLTGITWVFGLLSKENAVILPLVILVRQIVELNSSDNNNFTFAFIHQIPFLLIGFVWISTRWVILEGLRGRVLVPPQNPLAYVDVSTRIMTGIKVLGLYIRNTLFPFYLSADYSFNQIPMLFSPLSFDFVLSSFFMSIILLLLLWCYYNSNPAFVGLVFYLSGLLLISNLIIPIGTIMADRLLYLPLAGFCIALAHFMSKIQVSSPVKNPSIKLLLPFIPFLFVGALSFITLKRNMIWKNDSIFWFKTIQDAPKSTVANYNYAKQLLHSGNQISTLQRSLQYARNAVSIAEKFPGPPPVYAYSTYARCAQRLAKILKNSSRKKKLITLGIGVLKQGINQLKESMRAGFKFNKEGPRGEKVWHLYHRLGILQFEMGKQNESRQTLSKAIRLKRAPLDLAILGKIFLEKEKYIDAESFLREALSKERNNQLFWKWYAELFKQKKQYGKAITILERSARTTKKSLPRKKIMNFYRNWIKDLLQEGKTLKAEKVRQKAEENYDLKRSDFPVKR